MSLFPDYLELQRNQSWAIDQKSDSHIPRNSMNKLVMDCLITEGFKEAAEKFRIEAGIPALGDKNSDLSSMDNRIKIRDSIQAGRISEATAMVHQLHPELLDDDRYLFFHLQVNFK